MNIVKLKDIIKEDDLFFNRYLKGKYAWWIHMRYIVPFEKMGVQGYIACEEDLNDLFRKPYGTEFRDVYDQDMWPYIDQEATDAANSWAIYETKNKYSTDTDLTTDEVKQFRTWLATTLLSFDQDSKGNQENDIYTSNQTHVLIYYANDMFDDVVKGLVEFGGAGLVYNTTSSVSCGCGSSTDLSQLYAGANVCDPLSIYRRNIYAQMVEMFSEIDFWTQFDEDFITEFKKYVDNILALDLTLTGSDYINKYADCTCATADNSTNKNILYRLSQALQYIIDGQVFGHKNYIHDALYDWSSILYESMEW